MVLAAYGDFRLVEGAPPQEGSTAVLYEAVHARTGQAGLVKLLRPEWLGQGTVRRRFQEEAAQTVTIRHPGVVKVLDAGEEQGEPYLVLEKLVGQTLRERLRRGGVRGRELVLAEQLVHALGAVHAAGVTHRDLKPENLFLVADADVGGGERVVILDFGIAKPRERADAFSTAQGSQVGTEPYMAPEQWADPSAADARTDLYAVGCILFELYAGEPPFGTSGNLGAAHALQAPPALPPSAPRALARVVTRLLEKAPEARYPTCEALHDALARAAFDEESTSVRVARPAALASPPASTRVAPRALAVAAAVGLMVGAALGVAVGFAVGRMSSSPPPEHTQSTR